MSVSERVDIRNIAIVAHVDYGKTTPVDGILRQARIVGDNQIVVERMMDSSRGNRMAVTMTSCSRSGPHRTKP